MVDIAAQADPAIWVKDLSRSYVTRRGLLHRTTRKLEALRGVSFQVERGELFGLLGPNGAGKTTTVRILASLLLPDAGQAVVLGRDVVSDAREVRRRIGFLFGGERGLYGRVSARQNLRYFANLYGLSRAESSRRIGELLEVVGLADRAADLVDTYSHGMRQRLHIARVLLHDPQVLYLDEPTVGLDPVAAREVRNLVAGLTATGRTVLLTTHYMPEADSLCDRITVIDKGQIVASDTPKGLRRLVPDLYVLEVEMADDAADPVARLERLAGRGSVLDTSERDGRRVVRLQSARGPALVEEVPRALGDGAVRTVLLREPSLEDVYVRLVSPQAGHEHGADSDEEEQGADR